MAQSRCWTRSRFRTSLLSGGYPAPYINRTSSVLQIAQREGDRERFRGRGRVTLGFAGGGTILEGPIKKNRGSCIVSVRRSFLDAFTGDIGFGGVPSTLSMRRRSTI